MTNIYFIGHLRGLFFILGGLIMYDLICSYLNALVPLLPFLIGLRLIFDLLRNLVFDSKRSV